MMAARIIRMKKCGMLLNIYHKVQVYTKANGGKASA
jgi:hypothetical protein